ncbi:50S ribosomal protein L18 [Candidatus Microgenomates bacterium]|nr:50S ribosomal protein L18 [Candidatus Microgenomates bacterium]
MIQAKITRAVKTRAKLGRNLPRLSVFRSNRHIWAQIIDDAKGETLAAASSKELKSKESINKKETAYEVGKLLGQKAKEQKITKVVFDRGPYQFHGRIAELARGAREGGLKF